MKETQRLRVLQYYWVAFPETSQTVFEEAGGGEGDAVPQPRVSMAYLLRRRRSPRRPRHCHFLHGRRHCHCRHLLCLRTGRRSRRQMNSLCLGTRCWPSPPPPLLRRSCPAGTAADKRHILIWGKKMCVTAYSMYIQYACLLFSP